MSLHYSWKGFLHVQWKSDHFRPGAKILDVCQYLFLHVGQIIQFHLLWKTMNINVQRNTLSNQICFTYFCSWMYKNNSIWSFLKHRNYCVVLVLMNVVYIFVLFIIYFILSYNVAFLFLTDGFYWWKRISTSISSSEKSSIIFVFKIC